MISKRKVLGDFSVRCFVVEITNGIETTNPVGGDGVGEALTYPLRAAPTELSRSRSTGLALASYSDSSVSLHRRGKWFRTFRFGMMQFFHFFSNIHKFWAFLKFTVPMTGICTTCEYHYVAAEDLAAPFNTVII